MAFFCNTKNRTPIINQSLLVYEFTYPGCGANYVGKTKRTLFERCTEHEWSDQNSIVKNPLDQCVEVQYLLNITSKVQLCFQIITILGEVTLEIQTSV